MKTLRVTLIVCDRSHTILIRDVETQVNQGEQIDYLDTFDRPLCTIPADAFISQETVES